MWTRRSFAYAMAGGIAGYAGGRGFCSEEATVFELKMISSGDNCPTVDVSANGLREICAALHRRKEPDRIERELGITSAELRARIDSLIAAGLVKRAPAGRFLPAFLVAGLGDAKWLAPDEALVAATAERMGEMLPKIRQRSEAIPAIGRSGFARNAFLILSDVVLDNWQIQNVEREFLKAERPLRNGRRYYYAMFEKPARQRGEAFGIYGNAGGGLNNIQVSVYGKQRYDGSTLISLPPAEFATLFGFAEGADGKGEAAALLERVVVLARTGEDRLSARQREGLARLGLIENGELAVTVFRKAEAEELHEVAALFTPSLLGLLEEHRGELEKVFERSGYSEEVTFNEFFLWWYHFFYTAATDRLAGKGLLQIPRSGNVTYLIAD